MRLFSDVASRVDDPYFAHALSLAVTARGRTAPNPMVGCVVVSGGRIVGEGFHPAAGQPHAEVFALRDAGDQAHGASMYVTLEPCSHHGRTPPCTDAIIAAGIREVVVGMPDPSENAGGGAQKLRDAGIRVTFADDPAPFAELNEGWLKRLATGAPRIVAKVALSLDGHPGFAPGARAAMTGPSGAVVTRRLRQASDAVLVGASTVDADDPSLTVRDEDGMLAPNQPVRVVLVRSALPSPDARLFTDGAARTVVLAPAHLAEQAERDLCGAEIRTCDPDAGLAGVWRELGAMGLNDVLVEPGPRLFRSVWRERAFDELVTVTAGGMAGTGATDLCPGAGDRADATLVHNASPAETGIVGDVVATVWRPAGTL